MSRLFMFVALLLSALAITGVATTQFNQRDSEKKIETLRAELIAQHAEISKLQFFTKSQSVSLATNVDLTNTLAGELVDMHMKQKPKPQTGWVDCWTSNGKRNCVDAQGNTSSRNF